MNLKKIIPYNNQIILKGAYINKTGPNIAILTLNLSNLNFSVTDHSKKVLSQGIIQDINYEKLNQFLSEFTITSQNETFKFGIGIFPHETNPIDNITETIISTFSKHDHQFFAEMMTKEDIHSPINFIFEIIKDSISKTQKLL